MDRWIKYTRERFPLGAYSLLVFGLTLTGLYFRNPTPNGLRYPGYFSNQLLGFWMMSLGFFIFFFESRLMDEVAHLERPLARGLITPAEAKTVVRRLFVFLLTFGVIACFILNMTAGLLFIAIASYLWLMYREFFLGVWIRENALLYGVTHQLVVIPLVFAAIAAAHGAAALSIHGLAFSFMIFAAFFCHEISRKLDPAAHPRPWVIFACLLSLDAIALASARVIGVARWTAPIDALLVLSLPLLLIAPKRYKIIEGLATLMLLVHLWIWPVRHWLNLLS